MIRAMSSPNEARPACRGSRITIMASELQFSGPAVRTRGLVHQRLAASVIVFAPRQVGNRPDDDVALSGGHGSWPVWGDCGCSASRTRPGPPAGAAAQRSASDQRPSTHAMRTPFTSLGLHGHRLRRPRGEWGLRLARASHFRHLCRES